MYLICLASYQGCSASYQGCSASYQVCCYEAERSPSEQNVHHEQQFGSTIILLAYLPLYYLKHLGMTQVCHKGNISAAVKQTVHEAVFVTGDMATVSFLDVAHGNIEATF